MKSRIRTVRKVGKNTYFTTSSSLREHLFALIFYYIFIFPYYILFKWCFYMPIKFIVKKIKLKIMEGDQNQ